MDATYFFSSDNIGKKIICMIAKQATSSWIRTCKCQSCNTTTFATLDTNTAKKNIPMKLEPSLSISVVFTHMAHLSLSSLSIAVAFAHMAHLKCVFTIVQPFVYFPVRQIMMHCDPICLKVPHALIAKCRYTRWMGTRQEEKMMKGNGTQKNRIIWLHAPPTVLHRQ